MQRERWNSDANEEGRILAEIWRDMAVADGWSCEPTYKPEDPHFTLTHPSGWKAMIDCRCYPKARPGVLCCKDRVSIWAPDGLGVNSVPYNMDWLCDLTRVCDACGERGVATVRIAFANRVCKKCRADPSVVAKYEPKGWCD